MNENEGDLKRQRAVADLILAECLKPVFFVGHRFSISELKTEKDAYSHDFDVWFDKLHVGIIEVKGADVPLAVIARAGGFIADREKLAYLYRSGERGFPAILAYSTSDRSVHIGSVPYLTECREQWAVAKPEHMMTTNHGMGERVGVPKGYRLPVSLFTYIGKISTTRG